MILLLVHEGGVLVYCRCVKAEVEAEFAQHRDLVQGNFIDSYRNLTLKAVMGLRWMSTYCSEAPFAIKTDDDTFLNIFEMVRLMNENVNKSHVRIICSPCSVRECFLQISKTRFYLSLQTLAVSSSE